MAQRNPDKFGVECEGTVAHKNRRGPAGYQSSEIERFLVELLVAEDISLNVIRRLVNVPKGLSLNTFKKRFDAEISTGRLRLLVSAISCLHQVAADPKNPHQIDAAIYLTKRYGQRC